MSKTLDNARMPSLRDKIREEAEPKKVSKPKAEKTPVKKAKKK